MRVHRFYISPDVVLSHDFWLHDERLLHQWKNVLRFAPGQETALFDGQGNDALYRIEAITDKEAHLLHVTDFEPRLPAKDIYLLWALLKKDKNDWVLQKCTELGVSHFIPLLAARCERFDLSQNRFERWQKIVIEAAEQCGRSDIPNVRKPVRIETAVGELKEKVQLLVCEKQEFTESSQQAIQNSSGVLVGPEGGWSGAEKELFKKENLGHLNLHDFTLRAETATIAAVAKLLQ